MALPALRRLAGRTAYRAAYRVLLLWWFVRRPRVRGAYVALWVEDQLLMIRNSYRRPWTVPSGGIDRHEVPVDAARRELREEVGITLDREAFSYLGTFANPTEFKRDSVELFEARLDVRPAVVVDDIEVVEARFMGAEDALKLPLAPVVRSYLERCLDPLQRSRPARHLAGRRCSSQ